MKIAVIGGGIIGTYLALEFAKKGEKVTVFEKEKRSKRVCSGLVTGRIWDYIPKNKSLILNEFKQITINFPKKTIKLNVNPHLVVLDRTQLNDYIRKLAKKAGVKFVKREIKKIHTVEGFDFLVGAFGANSIFMDPYTRLGVYTHKNGKKNKNLMEIIPLKKGFAWEFSRGNNIEHGVIEEIDVAKKHFDDIHGKSKGKIYAAKIPMGLYVRKDIPLVGDAAGLCKPHSGGGIIWGFESANILLENYPNISKYNTKLRKFFEPRIFVSTVAMKLGMFMGYHLPWLLPKEIAFDNDWIF